MPDRLGYTARCRTKRVRRAALGLSALLLSRAVASAAPVISQPFASRFQISNASTVGDLPLCTQMTFGPDGRLYVTNYTGNISSYAYNSTTGALTDKQSTGVAGFGIGFATHAVPGVASQNYMYVSRWDSTTYQGSIARLGNTDGDVRWGEAGEVNVDLVRGIPIGDHSLDQVVINNNALYVGIGIRTNNGGTGNNTALSYHDTPSGPVTGGGVGTSDNGFTYGETSYNGAIGTIRDLRLVPNTTSAAQLRDGANGTTGNLLSGRDPFLPSASTARLPYTSTANDKLVVHSAGTRNPFGLATDAAGNLWFTSNYSRSDTNGDGTATWHFADSFDSDLSNDVNDQLFKAVAGGDYRYANANYRGTTGFPTTTVISKTFDNLDSSHPNFGQLHDPANPVGLGPSSSSDGLDFGTLDLTGIMATDAHEYALIARWNSGVTENSPGTDSLDYRDIVAVDPDTGFVRRLAEGFDNPIDVVNDGHGGYLIADWKFTGTIWRISPRSTSSRWGLNGNGTWSSAGSWTGPVPNAIGAVANFTGAIGADATVQLDSPRTIGSLNFDNLHRYTLTGTSTLTIDVAAGYGAIDIIGGSHEIQTPLRLLKNTTIDIATGGALTVSGTQSAAVGVALTKIGGGTLAMKHVRASGLIINDGTVQILSDGGDAATSQIATLTFAGGANPTSTLDLSNNDLIVTAGNRSLIQSQIRFARNGGAWDRPGLSSTAARSNSMTTLGVLAGAEYTSIAGETTFAGLPFAATDTLIKYTWNGDADFNDRIDFDDYSRMDNGFNHQTEVSAVIDWFTGDFNYDGRIDFDDYALIDNAFNAQSGTLARALAFVDGDRDDFTASPAVAMVARHLAQFGPAYEIAIIAAVPEPDILAVPGAVMMLAFVRGTHRRRRAAPISRS